MSVGFWSFIWPSSLGVGNVFSSQISAIAVKCAPLVAHPVHESAPHYMRCATPGWSAGVNSHIVIVRFFPCSQYLRLIFSSLWLRVSFMGGGGGRVLRRGGGGGVWALDVAVVPLPPSKEHLQTGPPPPGGVGDAHPNREKPLGGGRWSHHLRYN